jgi:PKD repeat protein
MRRFIGLTLGLVLMSAFSIPAAAQCGARTGDWGYGPTHCADGDGSIAVFGSARVLQIARVVDPTMPALIASLPMPGMVVGVQVVGTWVFVAASLGGIVVVDISTPAHPEIAAVVDTGIEARNLTVAGGLVFAVDAVGGLVIIDASDPGSPVQLSALAVDGVAHDVAIHGTLAFVAEQYTGLRVVDVADPSNPVSVAVIEDLDHSFRVAVTEDGATVYLSNYFEGFHVIDVSDHLAPQVTGFVELSSYTIDLEVDGASLYVANRGYGMRVFDIADPAAPVEVATVNPDGENQSVSVRDGLAYLGNYDAGLRLVDVAIPGEAEEIGFIDGTPEAKGAAVQGSLAHLPGGGRQVILDLARPDRPVEVSVSEIPGYLRRAVVDDRYVYAADATGGLRVIDIADPARPEAVGFVDTPDAVDVVKVGSTVYLATYDDGVRVVDVETPTVPTILGSLGGFHTGFMANAGGVLFVPEYNVGVHLVDVSTPTAPTEVGLVDGVNPIGRPEVSGDMLYVADTSQGIRVYDIANPRAPVEIGTIDGPRYGFGMAAIGHLLFVATIYDGFHIFDVADPALPVEIASGPLASNAEGEVSSEGTLALVAEVEGGLEVFDLGVCITQPPAADLRWRPASPEAGRAVQLTDTSIGAIATRQWSFGDGGSSSERNPVHVWAEPGDHQVSLTVSGPYGSQTATRTVTVLPRSGGVPPITDPGDHVYVVAAASHARGLAETRWVTDVVLHNPAGDAARTHLWFLKAGQSNLGADGQPVTVAGGASLLIDDVVLALFGEDEVSGALLIGADRPLVVTSRTYNDAASGTYGQFIPGRELAEAVGTGETVRLVQLTRSADYRTNLGVANPTGDPVSVEVELVDAAGNALTTRTMTVPAYGFLQRTDILGADVADAVAVVSSPTLGAAFFPYASVVDNRTGDPMMVRSLQSATELVVAAAAHVGGLEGTDWRTDLEVCNFNPQAAELDLAMLVSDQANTSPATVSMSLAASACERVPDVLDTLFDHEGSAALELRAAKHELMASSRTYNRTADGTYGQFLPGEGEASVVTAGQEARLVQLAQSAGNDTGFRTNLGFVNRTATAISVTVDLRFGTGTSLGTLTVPLAPFEHHQINRVFRQVTGGEVANGFAVVSTASPGAAFVAYASVVDNASGDPVYIPGTTIGD